MTSSVENTGISALVNGVMFIVLGIYIVSFSVEMFAGRLTKAEVEIIESLPEDEDTYENSYISSGGYDELVASIKRKMMFLQAMTATRQLHRDFPIL